MNRQKTADLVRLFSVTIVVCPYVISCKIDPRHPGP